MSRSLLLAGIVGAAATDTDAVCMVLDPKDPCVIECDGSSILRFNLKSFISRDGKPYIGQTDSENFNYWFDACTAVVDVECAEQACPAGNSGFVAAVQSWDADCTQGPGGKCEYPKGNCANLGCWATQKCTTKPGIGGSPPGMHCTYTGGTPDASGDRSLTVIYECNPHLHVPDYHAVSSGNSYTITLEGAAACGAVWVKPLSWGSLTLILLPIAITLYLAGGVGYNIKVRKKQGVAAIPQVQYWKALPGLVKDGCKYSYEISRKLYYSVVHGSAPPLHSDLKLRLADNEDGGATSRT